MDYLLDTDTCIALIKQKSRRALDRLLGLPVGAVGISSITLAELLYGVAKSEHKDRNKLALKEFLLPLEIADFDAKAAEAYGPVRAGLEKDGKPIGPLDTQIGAHALSRGVVLVTHNTREFRRIPKLKLADWIG
jgi:tRNA(fMet)-specific endonuclease VapC